MGRNGMSGRVKFKVVMVSLIMIAPQKVRATIRDCSATRNENGICSSSSAAAASCEAHRPPSTMLLLSKRNQVSGSRNGSSYRLNDWSKHRASNSKQVPLTSPLFSLPRGRRASRGDQDATLSLDNVPHHEVLLHQSSSCSGFELNSSTAPSSPL